MQLAQSAQIHLQNNKTLEKIYIYVMHLRMLSDALRDLTSLNNYINNKLIRKLDVTNVNYAKLSK